MKAQANKIMPLPYRISYVFLIVFIILDLLLLNHSAFAESAYVQKVQPSLTALNLRSAPTNEELMAAGQLGGQLYPTYVISDAEREKEINLSFGNAIQEWNKHNYKESVILFKKHIEDYPDSPWVSESILHIGCYCQYHGRYTEAEGHFDWIIKTNSAKNEEGARRLYGKALLRLGMLRILQSDFDAAVEIFAKLKKESLDWRERTYASQWIQKASVFKSEGLSKLKCGSDALAYLVEKEGERDKAMAISNILPSDEKGQSISDILGIAADYGYKLLARQLSYVDLAKAPLPAIIQLDWKNKIDRGHYWIVERISEEKVLLYDPQTKNRFTQSAEEFSKEWSGRAIVMASKAADNIPGIEISSEQMESSHGGCCGAPLPEGGLGNPSEDNPAAPRLCPKCQSAFNLDPRSASNTDPPPVVSSYVWFWS